MFEEKTLSLSFSTLSIQINHKVNEDRSQNRVSNEYAKEHTHTWEINSKTKKAENLGNTPFFLNVSRGETPQFRGQKEEKSPETTMTLTGWWWR